PHSVQPAIIVTRQSAHPHALQVPDLLQSLVPVLPCVELAHRITFLSQLISPIVTLVTVSNSGADFVTCSAPEHNPRRILHWIIYASREVHEWNILVPTLLLTPANSYEPDAAHRDHTRSSGRARPLSNSTRLSRTNRANAVPQPRDRVDENDDRQRR